MGPSATFHALMAYFGERFARAAGRPPWQPVAEWSDDDRAELRRRVEALQTWVTDDERDAPRSLALDETRLGDSFEAWLAVITPHGPGWLLGKNRD